MLLQVYHRTFLLFEGYARIKENYSYFGARYYDPNISIWLSVYIERSRDVDPLSDKYPSHSPYNYTLNNPILLVDPDGTFATKYTDEEGNTIHNTRDGSTDVVVVSDEQRAGFDAAVKRTKNTDDVIWNNTIKESLNKKENNSQEGFSSGFQASMAFKATKSLTKKGFKEISKEFQRQQEFNETLAKNKPSAQGTRPGVGLKVPKALRLISKYGGPAISLYGAYEIDSQYRNGEIDHKTMLIEQGSNAIGTIPVIGTSWNVGWNLGKRYGPSTW